LALALQSPAIGEERKNYFQDPFMQVTSGLAGCPVPEEPLLTLAEMRAEGHARTDRGTRCYMSGRCRLPNSYLYDKEIVPRVKQYILQDGRFGDTSVWITGQRRWVFLKGCVTNESQSAELERLAGEVDDVEIVFNELMVGIRGKPKYRTAAP
jgi:osmotically-inducible protein OsmY